MTVLIQLFCKNTAYYDLIGCNCRLQRVIICVNNYYDYSVLHIGEISKIDSLSKTSLKQSGSRAISVNAEGHDSLLEQRTLIKCIQLLKCLL